MKIMLTRHAEKKIKDLNELGVNVTEDKIKRTLNNPLHTDSKSDYPNRIISGKLNKGHVLSPSQDTKMVK